MAEKAGLVYLIRDSEFIVDRNNISNLGGIPLIRGENYSGSGYAKLHQLNFGKINLQAINADDKKSKNYRWLLQIIDQFKGSVNSESPSCFADVSTISFSGSHPFDRHHTMLRFTVEMNNNFLRSLSCCCTSVGIHLQRIVEVPGGYWRSKESMLKEFCGISLEFIRASTSPTAIERRTLETTDAEAEKFLTAGNVEMKIIYKLSISVQLDGSSRKNGYSVPLKLGEPLIVQSLFEHESSKDITIVTADGSQIKCHKIFLAAQSTVLETMLTCNMVESKSGVIHLDDMGHEAVTQLVRYLYGMEISPSLNCVTISQLFQASHKYKLQDLEKGFACNLLHKSHNWFTTDVALELYFFVKCMGGFDNLLKHILMVLSKKPSMELRSSDRFKELKQDEAMDLIMMLNDTLNLNAT